MLQELTEQEFNEFSNSYKDSLFYQTSSWGKLKESTGWKYFLVGLKDNNEIKAASLLLAKKIPVINKYIFYSPRGFLIDYNNYDLLEKYTKEIIKFVKEKKGIFFKINPLIKYQDRDINGDIVKEKTNQKIVDNLLKLNYEHVGFTIDYGKDIEPRWISVLNLENKTYDEVKSLFRQTTRNDINNSYKKGLKLVEIDNSRMDEFKKLMASTGERRGFIDRPLSYYKKMYECFEGNIKVMLVELDVKANLKRYEEVRNNLVEKIKREEQKENKKMNLINELNDQLNSALKQINEAEELLKKDDKVIVAGGLFMCHSNQVVSLFGASYKEYMKFKGQYLLNNEMIKYAIENGYDKFNFYGITGHFEKDSPMYGLFDFKRSFNADVNELIGEFTYVINKFDYFIYKIMKKCYSILKKVKK